MSSFAWLDFSESDRQKALDVIDLFREKGTVDELGVGTIRDVIADLLFPGTSTIMTRARYFLFIPWVYLRHEQKRTPSSEIARAARGDELRVTEALRRGGGRDGVFGIEAGAELKRLPSTIYWQGLGVLGIRRYDGSLLSYHRALDSFYRKGDIIRGDDGHVIAGGNLRRWDPALPPLPKGWLRETTLQLSADEANYLRERIIQAVPHSLFAFLVDHPFDQGEPTFPWEHELADTFPAHIKAQVAHARNFSQAMHGSALLYNLMLAEKKQDADRVAGYRGQFDQWAALMHAKSVVFRAWDQSGFWAMVQNTGSRIARQTQSFVNLWLGKAIGGDCAALQASKSARTLIAEREHQLKGELARLHNPRALDLWGGASSSEALNYRWNRPVTRLLADIRRPLDA